MDTNYPITANLDFFARADARLSGETWFHTVQEGNRPTIFMPLFELGFGPGAGALGTAEYSVTKRDAYSILDLRAGVGNDNWSLMAFASNLTDESYLEEVIPAPEFGGTFNYPGTERRYGLELNYRF